MPRVPMIFCCYLAMVCFGFITIIIARPQIEDAEILPGVTINPDDKNAEILTTVADRLPESCGLLCNRSCKATGHVFGICPYNDMCFCIDKEALEATNESGLDK